MILQIGLNLPESFTSEPDFLRQTESPEGQCGWAAVWVWQANRDNAGDPDQKRFQGSWARRQKNKQRKLFQNLEIRPNLAKALTLQGIQWAGRGVEVELVYMDIIITTADLILNKTFMWVRYWNGYRTELPMEYSVHILIIININIKSYYLTQTQGMSHQAVNWCKSMSQNAVKA